MRAQVTLCAMGLSLFWLSGCGETSGSEPEAYLSARRFQAARDTWFKAEMKDSSQLPDDKKCLVPAGGWVELDGPPRKAEGAHYLASLREPLTGCPFTKGFLFMDHFPMNYETPAELPDDGADTRPYLRLTRTGAIDGTGLYPLRLELRAPDGAVLDSVSAVSGARTRQTMRKWRNSVSGSLEPIPEGEWILDPLYGRNGLTFAGRYGDYDTTFAESDDGSIPASLGPVYAPLYYRHLERDRALHVNGRFRSEVGFHLDAGTPGTAGCVGVRTLTGLKRLVGWFAEADSAPRLVQVDWGLGTSFPSALSFGVR